MPKKFSGENSKAVAAKERKDAVKNAELQKKKAQEEDEYWRDDDKKVMKKQQKKDEMDKKKQEQLEKKAMVRALEEQETEQIKKESGAKQTASKITRAQILAENEKREAAVRQAVAGSTPIKPIESHLTWPLPENINRLVPEGVEARTVDEAIAVLSIDKATPDKHPEKRMKAAYTAFEEKNLPRLKQENPNMRLSQIKQLLHKEWLKSPENPFNQKI